MLINSKLFTNIQYFLSGRTEVKSLQEGASLYGGATKFDGEKIYSNIEGTEEIKVNQEKNTLSVIIPSTLNADVKINNKEYVKRYVNLIINQYGINNLTFYNSNGSYYSDDLKKVIIEDNAIITLNITEVKETDIKFMLNIGEIVRDEMTQECVSVLINDSLCLV